MYYASRRRSTFLAAATLALVVLPPSLTPASTWINPAGGSWSDPANWSPAQVPNSLVQANFNLAAQLNA